MTKRFIFEHPDQLKNIVAFCKEDASRIANTAKVWSVNSRKGIKTPWDGKIGVLFSTEGRERKAHVFRLGINDQMNMLGNLKYVPALRWCESHLPKAE